MTETIWATSRSRAASVTAGHSLASARTGILAITGDFTSGSGGALYTTILVAPSGGALRTVSGAVAVFVVDRLEPVQVYVEHTDWSHRTLIADYKSLLDQLEEPGPVD